MGTIVRKNMIAHLSEKLPHLTATLEAGTRWLNLWCGVTEDGKPKLVARTTLEEKVFNVSETDYHQEVVDGLIADFVANHQPEKSEEPAKQPGKPVETPANPAKTAKKLGKKKKS